MKSVLRFSMYIVLAYLCGCAIIESRMYLATILVELPISMLFYDVAMLMMMMIMVMTTTTIQWR